MNNVQTVNMIVTPEVINKNGGFIGSYLQIIAASSEKNKNKETFKKLDSKRFFGKRFNAGGNAEIELILVPYTKEVEGIMQQPWKEVQFGSNAINLFAYVLETDRDPKRNGDAKEKDLFWLPYNADDFADAQKHHKTIFPVVRDCFAVMTAMSHVLDKTDEFNYQQTLIRLGAMLEAGAYCTERGLDQINAQLFQQQFVLTELFAEIQQHMFALSEDAVLGYNTNATAAEKFVGIAEFYADSQKASTNIYGGGFGFGAQTPFSQSLFGAPPVQGQGK